MNKKFLLSTAAFLLLAATILSFSGCSKPKTEENESVTVSHVESSTATPVETAMEEAPEPSPIPQEYLEDRYISPENFFTLDYTPYLPETQTALLAKNLQDEDRTASEVFKGSESIIPGLRDIDAYETEYSAVKPSSMNVASASSKNSMHYTSTGSFTVEDWGPRGTIPSEVKRPSFYVLFSDPVVPLAALSEQSSSSPYMEIDPPLKGTFRWYGTSLLSFDAEEDCNPRQVYTIKLNSEMRSADGKLISGETEFRTEAAPLRIEWYQPGYEWSQKNKEYVTTYDVPPEAAKELRVQFNYKVSAAEIAKCSTIQAEGVDLSFRTVQSSSDTVTYFINENLPYESEITLYVRDSSDTENCLTATYSTLDPFGFLYATTGSSYDEYMNPVYIYMSHPLNSRTVLRSISTEPAMEITEANLEVSGDRITLYNLPVSYGSEYTVFVDTRLQDKYGRYLSKTLKIPVQVPDAQSTVDFPDSGIRILESQFPHKMVFEYQNVKPESRYELSATDTPLKSIAYPIQVAEDGEDVFHLDSETRNTRIYEEVDLEPYLKDGKGAVTFKASVATENSSYIRTNGTTVQVTDLGVTARVAVNRTVVLVSRLSDGTPVEGASVYLYKNTSTTTLEDLKDGAYFAMATTGKDGLAIMEHDPDEAYDFFSHNGSYTRDSYPAIYAATEDDAVTYFPEGHSPWQSGIWSTDQIENAFMETQKTFIFTDRGLYRPGETVSFRGIDRNRKAGSYTPCEGDFAVYLEDTSWWDKTTYGTITGTTSEAGGFSGSFKLPDDMTPGTYRIRFKRDGSDQSDWNCPYVELQVAYFERVKFQTSLEMSETPVISGDTISAKAQSTYLAGGALSEASWYAEWFREPWYFTSAEPEFKDYTFGPSDISENRSYINYASGNLDAAGKAELTCRTDGEVLAGTPYRYRVSMNVTDAANQEISAAASQVVHPASFYIGLSKPASKEPFPKTGEILNFTYRLAFPDGTAVKNRAAPQETVASLAGESAEMKISLIRTDWNLVKQQGIGGDVYTRYEKEETVEYTGTVKLEAEGTISVKPQKAGYHILRVETKDSNGRSVLTGYTFFATGSGGYSWHGNSSGTISLTPDQSMYNPGDTAHLLLESPLPAGDYLITVEREGIFTQEVRHLDTSLQVLDIPVARNYVPVFYVSVSSWSVRTETHERSYGEKDVDKPQGYYGVTEVFVNPYVKAFSIEIDTGSAAYRPGEEAEITITATKGGKPLENAEITLMAVDRGVLDLIDYHVPDPISFFYDESNFPLCVKGGDSRTYLMDPVTYAAKNLAGGDADGNGSKIEERKDFNPTALFEPVITTDSNGKATCRFKLPDTLTTYRITALGVSGELLALQEQELQVKNPVNVQQITPGRLRIRDTAETGVMITNLDGKPHLVDVALEIETPETAQEAGLEIQTGAAFVDGDDSHTVTVAPGSTISVFFDVAATEPGTVNAVFTITSDILEERIVTPIIIEKPYIYETFTTSGMISGTEGSQEEQLIIPSYAEDGKGAITVTLDATRLGTLGQAVDYLFTYPYGCLEQQSSKMLPLVIFQDYIDVFGMDMSDSISDVRTCVKTIFRQWADCQLANGSFGYWPDSMTENVYVSARIAYIALLASQRGYSQADIAIDRNALTKALKFFLRNDDSVLSAYDRTFINYVLALSKDRTVTEATLRPQIESETASIPELVYTGLAALAINGSNSPLAKECLERTRSYIRPGTLSADVSFPDGDRMTGSFTGSHDEQLALLIKFYTLMNPDDAMISKLIYTLLDNQKAGYWNSTATTASVLDAFYTVIKTNNLDDMEITATTSLGSTQLSMTKLKGTDAATHREVFSFDDKVFKGISTGIELPLIFSKSGNGTLYYTASLKYALPYEYLSARDEGLGLSLVILDDQTGEEIKPASLSSSLVELESGRIYRAKLTLSTSRDRNFVAVRIPVPSGAEILNSSFLTTNMGSQPQDSGYYGYYDDLYDDEYGYSDYSGYYDYHNSYDRSDIYDNEVRFFWNSFGKGFSTVEFKFRAVRKGVFPTPPATGECMYESEVFGRTDGYLFTIK